MNVNEIVAYDYHPSVSTMLMDHWRHTDTPTVAAELAALTSRFPALNTVRLTHSFEAYQRSPAAYRQAFAERLDACASLGFQVISCLFNRWHDPRFDCGGTYLEQLIPDLNWAYQPGFYHSFLQDICLPYAADPRILLWETCNKPLGVYCHEEDDPILALYYEKRWLRELYCYLKNCDMSQPVAISFRGDYSLDTIAHLKKCCDIALDSPYYASSIAAAPLSPDTLREIGLPVLRVQDPLSNG